MGRATSKKDLRRQEALVSLIAEAMTTGALTLVNHALDWQGDDTPLVDKMRPFAREFVSKNGNLTRKVFDE